VLPPWLRVVPDTSGGEIMRVGDKTGNIVCKARIMTL